MPNTLFNNTGKSNTVYRGFQTKGVGKFWHQSFGENNSIPNKVEYFVLPSYLIKPLLSTLKYT